MTREEARRELETALREGERNDEAMGVTSPSRIACALRLALAWAEDAERVEWLEKNPPIHVAMTMRAWEEPERDIRAAIDAARREG